MRDIQWRALLLGAVLTAWTCLSNASDPQAGVTYLKQGWDNTTRQHFYFTPQGSRMIPAKWFMALEAKDGGMFSENANLKQYGFIEADNPSPFNPYRLPVGFAIDTTPIPARGLSLGLTCAACHTANVTVQGKVIRIDGAPANLDFDMFYSDLTAAVEHSYYDGSAFARFASRVLPDQTPLAISQLHLQLAEFQSMLAGDAVIRTAGLASGFGRVDALTQIVNALSVSGQKEPNNLRSVKAPTSYPHLWLAPHLEFVQWNPIVASPIARNGGEVLGVFGVAKLHGAKDEWYESSLLLMELHALEQWIQDLQPPQWDETIFGAIDPALAATGKKLFENHCVACHNAPPYKRTDPSENLFGKTYIKIGRINYKKVGTDPLYIESLLHRLVRTNEATVEANDGKEVVPALSFFLNAVSPVITRAMDELNLSREQRVAMNGFRLRPPKVPNGPPENYVPPSFTDLKAGPLAGVWATGPYLHNGSVPTVYELLSPVKERRKVFWTGGRELDLDKLGFLSENAPRRYRFDTSVSGNGNMGHLYPPQGLETNERLAIIEFLKIL